jgi:hypothetical protein
MRQIRKVVLVSSNRNRTLQKTDHRERGASSLSSLQVSIAVQYGPPYDKIDPPATGSFGETDIGDVFASDSRKVNSSGLWFNSVNYPGPGTLPDTSDTRST